MHTTQSNGLVVYQTERDEVIEASTRLPRAIWGITIKDMKTRTRIVLLVLVLTASGLVALAIASAVLASETPLTHEQAMRMSTAANALWFSFLLFQIPIVWLILRGLWAYRNLLQIPIAFLGSVLCSLGGGVLLLLIAENGWYRLALHFK
jgi:hypothetical protein